MKLNNMLRKLLIAASMFGAASPAYAHDWWILDQHHVTCISADQLSEEDGDPLPSTPEEITNFEVSQGSLVTPKEYRDSSGNLWGVELTVTSNSGVASHIDFFTSDDVCENFIKVEESNGNLTNPDDLN